MGAELESIRWTFQGKMNSWTFQGQLRLPLKQTLRRGREKKEKMRQEEKLCQQHTVPHVFSIQLSGLCHSYCDPLPNAPQKKKKKKKAREEKDPAMFFPSLLEMSSELPGRGMQAIPWSWGMTWERRYMGAIRGRERGAGPWLPASPGLFSLDLWSSHTDGDWLVCLSHLQPHRLLALINSVQNTQLHTARLVLPTCGLFLEQWFITNYHRRYREMCINAT